MTLVVDCLTVLFQAKIPEINMNIARFYILEDHLESLISLSLLIVHMFNIVK